MALRGYKYDYHLTVQVGYPERGSQATPSGKESHHPPGVQRCGGRVELICRV